MNSKPDKTSNLKGVILFAIISVFMLILIGRLFQLQIIEVGFYRHESNLNHILAIPLKAPRGDILDRNGVKLAQNHIQYDLYIATSGDDSTDSYHLETISKIAGLSDSEIDKSRNEMKNASGEAPVLIKNDIPLSLVVELKERMDEFQYALVDKSSKRSYPFAKLTSHLIGYIREIDENRLKELRTSGYKPGDLIGDYGIERQYETNLRGKAGRKLMEVDHRGHWVGLLKKWKEDDKGNWILQTEEFPSEKGKDLNLTIDIELQKRVAVELGENVGGAVVMDVHTGEILAMYSWPGFDANLFIGPVMKIDWSDLIHDPDKPLQNRTIQNAYPPGSVFKVITVLAGFNEAVVNVNTTVNCVGSIEVGDRKFRCWRRSGHGIVGIRRAISESCDVYFYRLSEKLGIKKLEEYSKLMGLGKETGIDLPGEKPGLLPNPDWKVEKIKEKWYLGDTINMSIGQGFLQTTPLQILRIYAYFANGGKLINPHLNKAVMTRDDTPEELKNIDNEIMNIIKDGLITTVNSGTGRKSYIPDMKIAGKTGTAEDPPRKKPHSWFVSYAPYDNPKVAMIVFGQNAGNSDEFAVPVSKKIYDSQEMRKYVFSEN